MDLPILLTFALVTLLSVLLYALKQRYAYFSKLGIDYEEPSLLLGNMWGLGTKRSFKQIWEEHYAKFKGTGPFAGFFWFFKPAAFILDKELMRNILIKDFNKFTDRGFFHNEEDDPLSGQLFLLDGHKWRRMRHKLSATFTSGKMKHMLPTVVRVAEEFVQVFGEMVQKSDKVEVRELLARFTTDVIGSCAFGIDCHSLQDPEAEFRIMGREALVKTRHARLVIAFMSSFPELARKLHMKQTCQNQEDFFLRIVKETVQLRESQNIRRNDFMDTLIDLKNNKLVKSETGEDFTNLTLEEITAQAFVFFAAGFETSSSTMGFALYELAQHQHIQDRVREEIESVLAKHNGELSYECVKQMIYLNQVISETLRLYTILPILNRQALEDYVVPGNPKYVIHKGMMVFIPAGALHRDERYYANANEFNPDHFEPEKVQQRDSVEWLPFGDGPRNCIGMRFGQMQARIGLAMLLKHFKFSACQQTQIPMQYNKESFLVAAEGGIVLKVEKI